MAKDDTMTDASKKRNAGATVAVVRARLAQLVWLVCVLCALVLALGALLVALEANTDNALVVFIKDAADAVDLGVFYRGDGDDEVRGRERGDQERPGQLGHRRDRVAHHRPDPGPHHPALTGPAPLRTTLTASL